MPEFLLHIEVMGDKQNMILFGNIFESTVFPEVFSFEILQFRLISSSFGDFQNFKSPFYYQANLNSLDSLSSFLSFLFFLEGLFDILSISMFQKIPSTNLMSSKK